MSGVSVLLLLAGYGAVLSLAHVGETERSLRWLVYAALAALDVVAITVGLLLAGLALPLAPGQPGAIPGAAAIGSILPGIGMVAIWAGLVGLVLLLPQVRGVLARLLPIEASRLVHTAALQYALQLVGLSAVVAITVPQMASDEALLGELTRSVAAGGLWPLWTQALGFVVLSLLGVGLLTTRSPRAVLDRLGVAPRIHWRWWAGVTALALVSAVLVDALWAAVDASGARDVERLSQALFAPFLAYGLAGALTIGISAGIGEEMLFRGAAQPRFGIVLTSMLFALIHTQYTVSPALLQVFLVGGMLGLSRRHANTTTAMAAHATYNFVLAALALYAPNLAP